jgi:hypothetical protein
VNHRPQSRVREVGKAKGLGIHFAIIAVRASASSRGIGIIIHTSRTKKEVGTRVQTGEIARQSLRVLSTRSHGTDAHRRHVFP